MDKIQKIIVLLLIIAIVFSAISVVLNLSFASFDKAVFSDLKKPKGASGSNVQLVVEPSAGNGG